MSVAVQHSAEKTASMPAMSLAGASLFGTVYVLFGWILVNLIIPILFWLPKQTTELIHHNIAPMTFMVATMVLAIVGLVFVGRRILPAIPGLKAGITMGVIYFVLGTLFVFWAWNLTKYLFPDAGPAMGAILPAAVGFLWFSFCLRQFRHPKFTARMERFEDGGWFTWHTYKKGQGLKARRGTMLGVILVAGAGIWTYFQGRHLTFGVTALPWATYWAWLVPYVDNLFFPVVIWPNVTLPLLLLALVLWIGFRLVNYPQFADFLIATEAEMNKVSWATGKRLFQDTIVVLVTVVLMAVFLYVVDYLLVVILKFLGIMRIG